MDWPSINISNLRWWESSCHQLQINAGVGWRHHHDAGRWNFLRLEIDWLTSLLTMVFSEFYATETLKEKLWHLNPTILHIVLHRISSDWLLYASSRKKCIPIMFLYKIKLRFRKIALIRRHRDCGVKAKSLRLIIATYHVIFTKINFIVINWYIGWFQPTNVPLVGQFV